LETRRKKKSVMEPPYQGALHFDELNVYVDGASRGNPGPAAIGVVILTRQGKKVASFGEAIGETTNNFAEYMALIHALRLLSIFEVDHLRIYTDSELMASQVNGDYRVKEKTLKSLYAQVVSMLRRYREYQVLHIPREENAEADLLANRALNEEGRLGMGAKKPSRKEPAPLQGQSRLFEGDTESPED
jgi:ribonuclease HI